MKSAAVSGVSEGHLATLALSCESFGSAWSPVLGRVPPSWHQTRSGLGLQFLHTSSVGSWASTIGFGHPPSMVAPYKLLFKSASWTRPPFLPLRASSDSCLICALKLWMVWMSECISQIVVTPHLNGDLSTWVWSAPAGRCRS